MSILRYREEGAWGVSPHLIPQQSLHAISGTISQALKIHGPNFGVSGGPNPAPDALLLAAAMLHDQALPGLWVALSGHQSEWIPTRDDRPAPAPTCQAVVLALTPLSAQAGGLTLSLGQAPPEARGDAPLADWPDFQLGCLAEELSTHPGLPGGKWRLSASHWVEFESTFFDREGSP
jgi:hypothetical protein